MLLLLFQKYLDTVTIKTITKFYKTTLPSVMIFTRDDTSTSDEKVEKFTTDFNIHYRSFFGSLIHLLSTKVELGFAVKKLVKFSRKTGKVHFEELVHLLRYIRDNKTLGLKYYVDTNDASVSYRLRPAIIKTENQLMNFSYYCQKYVPETGRITEAYNYFYHGGIIDHGTHVFYQGGSIDHTTHVPGPVDQSSAESEYNLSRTAVMALTHFRILICELLNKDPDIVPKEASIIVLDSKYSMCMSKNGKDTKHTSHIVRRINFVRNGEKFKMHNIYWCEGGLKLA